MFSALYTAGRETINIHSLLHLAEGVRNLGPLWTHFCFPFESYNGNLLKLFHGTQNVDLQIVSAVAILQSLPCLKLKLIPGSIEEEFFNSLMNPSHVQKEQIIEKDIAALGSAFVKKLNLEALNVLGRYFGYTPLLDSVPCFKQVRICGTVYHSLSSSESRLGTVIPYSMMKTAFTIVVIYRLDKLISIFSTNCVCPVQNLALLRNPGVDPE